MKKPKNHNGMYISLKRLRKYKPIEHPIPNKDKRLDIAGGVLIGGVLVSIIWILSLI